MHRKYCNAKNEFSESDITIECFKEVSSMLAMVSAVKEGSLERPHQAARDMIKQMFAFGHYNYARYLSCQHVSVRSMEQQNHLAIQNLKGNGFGGSISGEPFSSIHGDLITELFNKETKGTRGPMRAGFSTNHDISSVVHLNTIFLLQKLLPSPKANGI